MAAGGRPRKKRPDPRRLSSTTLCLRGRNKVGATTSLSRARRGSQPNGNRRVASTSASHFYPRLVERVRPKHVPKARPVIELASGI